MGKFCRVRRFPTNRDMIRIWRKKAFLREEGGISLEMTEGDWRHLSSLDNDASISLSHSVTAPSRREPMGGGNPDGISKFGLRLWGYDCHPERSRRIFKIPRQARNDRVGLEWQGVVHYHTGLVHYHAGLLHYHTGLAHYHAGLLHYHAGVVHCHTGLAHNFAGESSLVPIGVLRCNGAEYWRKKRETRRSLLKI